ncbi:acetyl-CoA C-acyltransferase [Pseudarthrobacter sp. AG30]|uniref:acetyl-CoA C-acetyltransferase n=1 Tax=Pseudarthrobacter sp. AG30 TaxID=2249742 RepID=UPI000D6E9B33|nr:acetyl-CoA C-acetyltransferase [Pseudarthrobacter sp. AG30]RAX15116.1 acetyl-CoA C-acyltransferase [Pseudarthrobacter sp. AG30]
MPNSVIVAGARTPIGRLLGSLSQFSAADLGGIAISAALEKAGVQPSQVEYVIMGQVLTAGAGQMPARQAAAKAGIPLTTPALNVNKVCLSGIESIILADQFIRSGAFDVIVAGGMESMSQAPHLLPKSRVGVKYGEITMADHTAIDGLQDAFTKGPMGLLTETSNDSNFVSREDQDRFALRSHTRAAAAWDRGLLEDEVVPVELRTRKGPATWFRRDETIRPDTTVESLASLRSAFRPDGTITAGNASAINDGACALVVMSKERAEAEGLTWLAEIGEHGMFAGPDTGLQFQPSGAIEKACKAAGIDPSDLDLIEINEAFAAVGVASTRALGVDPERVNVNGGAIAYGHPIGMSGARITLHLALELQRRGGGTGAAALCGGGGQGDALLLTVPKQGR